VGTAEADVIKMKISSMESGNYAAVQIAQALASNHIKLVPDIMAGGGNDQGGGLINVLLAKMLTGANGVNNNGSGGGATGSGDGK
jgi:tripartite-type tricarboxylate transporter receptor subunit TctC